MVRRLSVLRKDPANFSAAVAAKLRDRSRLVKASLTVERALSVVQVDPHGRGRLHSRFKPRISASAARL